MWLRDTSPFCQKNSTSRNLHAHSIMKNQHLLESLFFGVWQLSVLVKACSLLYAAFQNISVLGATVVTLVPHWGWGILYRLLL